MDSFTSITAHEHLIFPSIIGGSNQEDSEVEWTSVDDDKHKLDSYSLKPIIREHALGFDPGETEQPDYQLALTGDVFRWMLEFSPLETMQRVSSSLSPLIDISL